MSGDKKSINPANTQTELWDSRWVHQHESGVRRSSERWLLAQKTSDARLGLQMKPTQSAPHQRSQRNSSSFSSSAFKAAAETFGSAAQTVYSLQTGGEQTKRCCCFLMENLQHLQEVIKRGQQPIRQLADQNKQTNEQLTRQVQTNRKWINVWRNQSSAPMETTACYAWFVG